jgi:hypothetical protein
MLIMEFVTSAVVADYQVRNYRTTFGRWVRLLLLNMGELMLTLHFYPNAE